ncbi:MAG: hypothetical protein R3221_01580 [Spongiibacter sp.]|nr:hypothetical protein [Spongiibacter sp.]
MKKHLGLLTAALLISHNSYADVGIGVTASTVGAGLEVSYGFSDYWSARLGGLVGDIDIDFGGEDNNGIEGDELTYDANIEFRNAYLFADWHPRGKVFRLTAGTVINNTKARIVTRCEENSPIPNTTNCEFGNSRFSSAVLGDVITNISFDPLSPYIGLGWGYNNRGGFNFSADLGIAYVGDADVKMRSTGTCNDSEQCRQGIKDEQKEVKNELEDYRFLPLALISLNYQF